MKNKLESFAIFLVVVLSLVVVYLIVQYNMIEEDDMNDIVQVTDVNKKETIKTKTSNYLNSLEGYGDDVDVKVDARKEDHTNEVKVKSELSKDALGDVVEDKSKKSYMENLEHSVEKTDKQSSEKTATLKQEEKEKAQAAPSSGEPEQLPQEEVSDEIGEAIDAALNGL